MEYVVSSANWKIEVFVEDESDHPNIEYNFVEAATRALEYMYASGFIETFDGEKPKVGKLIQVCKKDCHFNIRELEDIEVQKRIDNGEVKFIFSPIALANAGRYEIASYLNHIIEE